MSSHPQQAYVIDLGQASKRSSDVDWARSPTSRQRTSSSWIITESMATAAILDGRY